MKILALELSNSESISLMPNKYGGAGRTLANLANKIPDFYVAASENSFIDCNEKERFKAIFLEKEQIRNLKIHYF